MRCIFTSDLHGSVEKYRSILHLVEKGDYDGIFMGGDLLPLFTDRREFIKRHLFSPLRSIRKSGGTARFFVIMGNDDPRIHEDLLLEADNEGLLDYVCERTVRFGKFQVIGYPFTPPSPFMLKDWERYDVSRHIEPGDVPPEEGTHTIEVDLQALIHSTISKDLDRLGKNAPADRTIFLFHAPPYGGNLDRAALDGKTFDHVPLDMHVGSVAIRRFIESHQPLLTLHGHVHESSRLTRHWRERIGRTHCFNGATDGDGLAIVRFDPDDLGAATRDIMPC